MRIRRDRSQYEAPDHDSALYATLGIMLANGSDYYYDGWATAIRRVSALSPETLSSILKAVAAFGKPYGSTHVGVQLIWAGAVSPTFCSDVDAYLLVVTCEGGLPASQCEFDRTLLSLPAEPPSLEPAPN